jgi:tetratricopeptide (TPR) repeat protein
VTVVAVALAAPGLLNGFVWDDHELVALALERDLGAVLTQPFLGEAGAIYYRPIPSLLLWGVARVAGPWPFAFHLLNLLVFGAVTWLSVGFLEARLARRGDAAVPAALAALALALHPSRPLAHAWVAGLGDLLVALFTLLAFAAWRSPGPSRERGLFVGLACVAAALSKEAGLVLPLALGLDALLGGPRPPAWRRSLGLASVGTMVAVALHARVAAPPEAPFELTTLPSRVLLSLGHLAYSALWPFRQLHQENADVGAWTTLPLRLGLLVPVGVLTLLLTWPLRRRPALRDLVLFLVLAAPSLNVVVLGAEGGTLSERYLFLPALGLAALLGRGLAGGRWRRPAVRAALAVALLAWAGRGLVETRAMRQDLTLFRHFAALTPDVPFVLRRLVTLEADAENRQAALRWAADLTRLETQPRDRVSLARGRHTLQPPPGVRRNALLRFAELELPWHLDRDQARLGQLARFARQLTDSSVSRATLTVEEAPIAVPVDVEALRGEGLEGRVRRLGARASARVGDYEGALAHVTAGLRSDPEDAALAFEGARALAWQGALSDAEEALRVTAARRHPGAPAFREAIAGLREAAAADRSDPVARHAGIALALARSGSPAAAEAWLDRHDVLDEALRARILAIDVALRE